jgi:hypothetical protein
MHLSSALLLGLLLAASQPFVQIKGGSLAPRRIPGAGRVPHVGASVRPWITSAVWLASIPAPNADITESLRLHAR